ncbi:MAG: ABC transporter ATP-binding protein [Cyanobacteria bacterium J06597_1]
MGLSFVEPTHTPTGHTSESGTTEGGVSLRGITKRFGTFVALEQIDLDIAPGSYTCLLGPSGCGKTTTLRTIAGHETVTSGEIWIGSRQVNDIPAAKRDTAMVFQNYALFPHMSVWDNIGFGLRMKGIARAEKQQRIGEILTLVDLEEFAKRKPFQLSGGQQQRVALARALVTRPQVVLLDEPLSALDESLRAKTRMELRKLQQQFGMTFIQVTHSQDEAFSLSDRVVVMDRGRIDQVGTPAQIFNRPASQFVARFVGDNTILDGTVVRVSQTAAGEAIDLEVAGIGIVTCKGSGAVLGQPAACCVRGDRLQLVQGSPDERDRLNTVRARISSVEFTGFVSRVSAIVPGGGSAGQPREFLQTIRTDDWLQSDYQEGQEIVLGWAIEDCIFLPR